MKKIFLSAIAMMFAFNVNASGIPTVDVAAILQQVQQYRQMLIDYKNDLVQTITVQDDLKNAYAEYNQMLSDYQQVVREAQALASLSDIDKIFDVQGFIDEMNDLDDLDLSKAISGKAGTTSSYSDVTDGNAYSNPNFVAAEREASAKYGYEKQSIAEYDAVASNIRFAGASGDQSRADFIVGRNAANEIVDAKATAMLYSQNIESQQDEIDEIASKYTKLGDNDTLKTMQAMLEQNQYMLNQNLKVQQLINETNEKPTLLDSYNNALQRDYQNRIEAVSAQYP